MLKTAQAFFACAVFCFSRGFGAKKKLVACFLKLVARILKSEPLICCHLQSRRDTKGGALCYMQTKTAAPQPDPPTRHHKKCILKHWYLNYRNFLDNSNIVAQQIRKHAKLFCSIFRNFVLATIINPLNRDKEFRDTQ